MTNAKITNDDILSDSTYLMKRVSFELEVEKDHWESQSREVFDHGNGSTILLYNKEKRTVVLTKQFRLPTYLNGNSSGMMVEACAGSIEDETPERNIVRETEEETGYRITSPKKIFEAYMSPAAVTEILHFFISEYDESMKKDKGGGNAEEHEHIQVLEVQFEDALKMISSGEIKDAKTIMLLQFAQLQAIFD